MPTKVYRESFEQIPNHLPRFNDSSKADVIFMPCLKPVETYHSRTFTPPDPYDAPFLEYRRNHEKKEWELVDEIELVD